MLKLKNNMMSKKLGVSYTVSAVIMTATAITLTLVAWSYANQILDQERGATEFDVAMDSMLAFNDAFENIAWKPQSSRAARFILDYGQLELIPDVNLTVNVAEYEGVEYSGSTGYIKYSIETKYLTFVEGYQSNFLGNDDLISNGAGSYSKGLVSQDSDSVSITLFYGIKAMKATTLDTTQGSVRVNNVDIWIVELKTTEQLTSFTELDLNAECLDVFTRTMAGSDGNGYLVENNNCTIAVQLGDYMTDEVTITLDGDKVVFNFVVASVQVSL
jgi:hypothetical protein